jgi:prepilin-type N-terminal cleavage/methylation domain-containing protein
MIEYKIIVRIQKYKKNMGRSKIRYKGFTLLEILLVIAAIGILAAIVLIAINPSKQIASARNATRQSDINTLNKAIEQASIENGGQYNSIITGLSQPTEICGPGGGCGGGYIDLSSLVPTYIAAIPRDPQAISPGSGYKVFVNPSNGKLSISATLAENNRVIAINPILWTPAALGASLFFWVDANDEASLTLNNQATAQTVSQWNDKSGNIRHLTQGAAASQPTLVRGIGNIMRYTQELDAAYWSKTSATVTTNTNVAPDGTITADTLTEASAGVFGVAARGTTVPNDNQAYTASIYVRKTTGGTSPIFGINFSLNGGTGINNTLRLNTDTGSVVGFGGSVTSVDAGSYWRVSVNVTNNTTGNTNLVLGIYPATAPFGGGETATATGSQVIWGAMINRGTTANEYIGRNSLLTDGVDDTMATGSFVLSQPFSRFSILTRNTVATDVHILNSIASTPNTALYNNGASGTSIAMFAGLALASSQVFNNGQTSQFGEIYNGASSTIFNNGTGTNGNASTTGIDGVRIASLNGTGSFSSHFFRTVLVLNRLPTTDERQRIEGYLAWTYGIQSTLPTGHPFINSPPIWI